MSSLFLICQALLNNSERFPSLFMIKYSYILSFASYLELKDDFLLILIIEIKYFVKKKFKDLKNFFSFLIFLAILKFAYWP